MKVFANLVQTKHVGKETVWVETDIGIIETKMCLHRQDVYVLG